MRRDIILYAVLFIRPPTRAAPHRAQVRLAPASSKIDPFRLASNSRLLFSSNSHTNFRMLPVRDITRTLSPVLSRSVVTSEWHVRSVRTHALLLYFDPSPWPKNTIPRWYTGRKWHIPMASNRKRSRGRIKAYDMGQGEGLIVPLQSCTGRE